MPQSLSPRISPLVVVERDLARIGSGLASEPKSASHSNAEGLQSVVRAGNSGEFRRGPLALRINWSPPAERLTRDRSWRWRDHRGTAISLAVHGVALLLIAAVPPESFALSVEFGQRQARYVPHVFSPPLLRAAGGIRELEPRPSRPASAPKSLSSRSRRRGRPRLPRAQAATAVISAQSLAERVGVVGLLRAANLQNELNGSQALDEADRRAIAETTVDRASTAPGSSSGLDPIGDGRSGGQCRGRNCGVVGDAELSTGPNAPGGRSKWRTGSHPATLADHTPAGPLVRPQRLKLRGALSKDIVRRIVHQHLNEVRYCFERALGDDRHLAGRVVLKLLIASNGRVVISQIAESTLMHRGIERCIAAAGRRWRFPSFAHQGDASQQSTVLVRYPFLLQAQQ